MEKLKKYCKEEDKNKDYELIPLNDVIKHPIRLSECLSILKNLRFIEKGHPFHVAFPSRGIKRLVGVLCLQSMRFIPYLKVWVFSLGFHKNKKYKINPIVKDIITVKEDMDSLNHYQELSRIIELNRNIISDADMSIYTSCEFVDAYNDSQETKEKVDRIKKDMKKLMTELSILNFEVHKACREKAIDDFNKILNEPESILGKVIKDNDNLARVIKEISDDTELQKEIRNDIEQQKKLMEVKPIVTVVLHSNTLHSEEFHFSPVKSLVSPDGKFLGKLAYQIMKY